jgi:hypothetical protein
MIIVIIFIILAGVIFFFINSTPKIDNVLPRTIPPSITMGPTNIAQRTITQTTMRPTIVAQTSVAQTSVAQTTAEIPIDCKVSDWSNWSNCSVSCGGGTQERTRSIITMPRGNGVACPILKDTRACNTDVCPVDCQVSDWSNWGTCTKSCGGGLQERTRSIITPTRGAGIACPELKQTKDCNTDVCSVDCQVSDWSNWSACPAPCGGTQERRRSIITQQKGTGNQCPELTEIKKCVECPLYEFTSHTFTTGGKSGPTGPTLAEVRSNYSGVNWAQNNEFLNMSKQGIQEWKVPITGDYIIKAAGAAGGGRVTYNRGRNIQLTTKLNKGEVINILVGQMGLSSSLGGGGGGGTFIVRNIQNVILVAGGGGGIGDVRRNESINELSDAVSPNIGNGNNGCGLETNLNSNAYYGLGGVEGNGGKGSCYAGGGAGLIGNGGDVNRRYSSLSNISLSFINNGTGGFSYGDTIMHGGFGGGGASALGGGGGGGYSGGGGCGITPDIGWLSGGGGGSYGIGNVIDNGAINVSAGFVEITLKTPTS